MDLVCRGNKKGSQEKNEIKMNILSFDIEEWYIEKKYYGGHANKYKEFDHYLGQILDLLDEQRTKATFFCLGRIATDFPYVVKSISDRGHDVGCHSNEHLWLTKMSPEELRYDTRDAIAALEDVSGQKVISYRAPAFSIGERNKWAFEVLASEGITRDASIFPAARDFGGFEGFPTDSPVLIKGTEYTIKEFPICLTSLLGKEIAYSGGGYFRFFPLTFIKSRINNSKYAMTYFHIGDLLHNKGGIMSRKDYETYFKESGTLKNRIIRYAKSNLGTKGAFDKMKKLVESYDFMSLEEADKFLLWDKLIEI